MHMAVLRLSDLRAWSRLIPVNTKNFRYSPATILLNSLLKEKGGSESGIDQAVRTSKYIQGWNAFWWAGYLPGVITAGLWEACWRQRHPSIP